MGHITRFTSVLGTYTFPRTIQSLDSNFRDVVARANRQAGAVDGGIDEFGTGWAPSAIGNLSFSFYLVSSTREGMQVKRDAAAAMRGWGAGVMFYQPTDLTLAERWVYCRINRISDTQQLDRNSDLHQMMQVNMQVTQPYWHTAGTERLWDDGGKFDDGGLWDGNASAPAPTSITGSGTLSATNNGNMPTMGRVLVINDGGSPAYNPIIRRIYNGEIADEVRWSGTIAAGDWLEINPRAQRVLMGVLGQDVYPDFSFMNPDWMKLLPGSNSLQVYLSGTAKVAIRYMERIA